MRSSLITVGLVVVGVLIALFLHDAYRAKRPLDDFGVGKAQERFRMIKSDFVRAADPAKTAVTEYYYNLGKWPPSNKDAGLPEPATYHGDSLKSLVVAENKITMTFDDKIGPDGGQIIFAGTYTAEPMGVKWDCVSPNIPDISTAIPQCRYSQ